jgi:hypothetical protein
MDKMDTMEAARLEELAEAQHESLCKLVTALRRHAWRSSRVRNSKLQSLGVVKLTPLMVDEQSPCDFERRFFDPSYKDEHLKHALWPENTEYVTGLVETGKYLEKIWGETFRPRIPDDPEPYLPPCPEDLPAFRFMWFDSCVGRMQQTRLDYLEWWEEEEDQRQHESRT